MSPGALGSWQFGFLFLGERPSGLNWFGVALIAAGAILVGCKR
jgi:transporter family protein